MHEILAKCCIGLIYQYQIMKVLNMINNYMSQNDSRFTDPSGRDTGPSSQNRIPVLASQNS